MQSLSSTDESMESGHSDSDVEQELMREEVLKERDEVLAGRRKNFNSYKDLSSDDDDWFMEKVLGHKRPNRKEDSSSESETDDDTADTESESSSEENDSDEV